jgi:predicted dehydrogenase
MNDGLAVMRIIDAAYESGRTGKRVDVIQGY